MASGKLEGLRRQVHFFLRIGPLVRVFFFEFLAIVTFSSAASNLIGKIFFRNCPNNGTIDWTLLICVVVGAIVARAVFLRIWYASYTSDGFRTALKMGSWTIVPNPFLGTVKVDMPTTHPSYVLLDLLMVITGGFFFWVGRSAIEFGLLEGPCGWNYQYYFGWSMIVMALFVPLFRLFVWYGLKHRIPKEYCVDAWRPVLMLWILIAAMVLPGIYVGLKGCS